MRKFSFGAGIVIVVVALIALVWVYPQVEVLSGYTVVTSDTDTQIPVGTALFTFRNSEGVLVSQAGVGASKPILRGRIFVDQDGPSTAIALANPSNQLATVTLILRNAAGDEVARTEITIGAGEHVAEFVSQRFSNLPAGFTGSLTFESDQPLGAITLRESRNSRNEPLYSTLPVVDLDATVSSDAIVYPQIAAGDAYTTQIILINSTGTVQKGKIQIFGSNGDPLPLSQNGSVSSEVPYEIAPNGTFRISLDRTAGLASGYAVVTPDAGNTTPSGTAIFQIRQDGVLVTEAGVGASPETTAIRIYVDNVDSFTAVAIVNRENQTSTVTFALLDTNGEEIETTARNLEANGHIPVFAHELFPEIEELQSRFGGLLEIRSTTPIAAITLKLTINEREEEVWTTLPVADLIHPPGETVLVFAHVVVEGGGFSTGFDFYQYGYGSSSDGRATVSEVRRNGDGSPAGRRN